MSAAAIPVTTAEDPGFSFLSARQREVVRLVLGGMSFEDTAAELGIAEGSARSVFYAGRKRMRGLSPPATQKWNRETDLDGETPREARARVARELLEGKRCRAPMLSGGPCSLLLPCASHAR